MTTKIVLLFYIISIALASAAIPFGGVYLKFDWIGAIVVIAYGGIRLANGYGRILKFEIHYAILFLSYLVINATTLLLDDGRDLTGLRSYFGQYLIAILLFIIISSWRIDTKMLSWLLDKWVFLGCFASLLAIAQRFSGQLLVDGFLYIPYYEDGNISQKLVNDTLASTAWFSEASWFGSFLVVPIIYTISKLILLTSLSSSKNARSELAWRYLTILLQFAGVYLGYSLTAIISILVGIIMLFILSKKIFMLLMISVLSVVFIFVSDDLISIRIVELFTNLRDFSPGSIEFGTATSFYVRSIAWFAGFEAFLSNPILGIGLGQGEIPFDSSLVTMAAELGLFGMAIYYYLPSIIIFRLKRISHSVAEKSLFFALISMLVGDYFNGFVTHNGFHLQRWLLISLVLAWINTVSMSKIAVHR